MKLNKTMPESLMSLGSLSPLSKNKGCRISRLKGNEFFGVLIHFDHVQQRIMWLEQSFGQQGAINAISKGNKKPFNKPIHTPINSFQHVLQSKPKLKLQVAFKPTQVCHHVEFDLAWTRGNSFFSFSEMPKKSEVVRKPKWLHYEF